MACRVLLAISTLQLALPAAAAAAASDTAIIYDKTGKHGQCSEGRRSYMADCVMPSDYFSYLLSGQPTLAIGQTCASLGYQHVKTDPIFSGFELYWRGGAAAAAAFSGPFFANHTGLLGFLNASRDANPACKRTSTRVGSPPPSPPLAPTARVIDATADVITYYDSAGVLPQCGEGPAAYMAHCVQPCDFVGFLLSAKPVQIKGAHCAAMGFTFATMDSIYVRPTPCPPASAWAVVPSSYCL